MAREKLIYIMDPHCLRSYANENAVKELYRSIKDNYIFEVLPGGMWKKENAPRGGREMKGFIQPLKGQDNIADSYYDLIEDSTYLLASDWPSQAIVAINEIKGEKTLDFAYALMKQQFSLGKRYDIERTYLDAMDSIDLDLNDFANMWKSDEMSTKTQLSFQRAENFSSHFPSLILVHDKGFKVLRTGVFRAKEVEKELLDRIDKQIIEHKVA